MATNDVKLQVAANLIYYPDVVVTDPDDADPLIITRPTFVVEVLSPHTANIDRREKMIEYRKLPSLLCYLVVHQEERRVERHWRDAVGDPWELDMVVEGAVKIPGLDVTLALDDIYEGIDHEAVA